MKLYFLASLSLLQCALYAPLASLVSPLRLFLFPAQHHKPYLLDSTNASPTPPFATAKE